MSAADTLAVLKLLTKGRPPAFVAEATGLTLVRVQAIADQHGWPDRQKLADAATDLMLDEMAGQVPVREPDPIPATLTTPAVRRDLNGHPPNAHGRPCEASKPSNLPSPVSPTIKTLLDACELSESKLTQRLGPKLAELAQKITTALTAEREAAAAKAKRDQDRTAAQAEVKRLEKALAEARAKAVAAGAPGGARGGPQTCPECADELANPQALGAHRRHKHGIRSSKPKTTRSAST